MRLHGKEYLGGLAILFFSLPVWGHTQTAHLYADDSTTIGSTVLRPGEYQIKADEGQNKVRVLQMDGKRTAEVPCTWIQLPAKAQTTQLVTQRVGQTTKLVEIDFGGTTEGVRFSD